MGLCSSRSPPVLSEHDDLNVCSRRVQNNQLAFQDDQLVFREHDVQVRGEELRNQAKFLSKRSKAAIQESQKAWKCGNRGRAKVLSNKGKRLRIEARMQNEHAANVIFQSNNSHRDIGIMDLHGLTVEEASERVYMRIEELLGLKIRRLVLIVGKGVHSKDSIAKLKPAMLRLKNPYDFSVYPDKRNNGRLVVQLSGKSELKRGKRKPSKHFHSSGSQAIYCTNSGVSRATSYDVSSGDSQAISSVLSRNTQPTSSVSSHKPQPTPSNPPRNLLHDEPVVGCCCIQ